MAIGQYFVAKQLLCELLLCCMRKSEVTIRWQKVRMHLVSLAMQQNLNYPELSP